MTSLNREDCVEFEIEEPVARATEKALLVRIEDGEVWIPKGQIHDDSEVYRQGDTGTLIVSEWIAKQKGLV